ncbi:aminopeptidase [Ventosimonas gracilis]|uniref:M18 family aminopeptidase n=1 Tax=Ventosimonas gracilis TaxID=1680762 RepID=A0A139SWE2_9GAMM|nr:M18 family aminopeptidase [Ventosimonas gracilis]KXU38935.1 aminopeptidase [Ventosimonas gracilis]
MSQIPALLDFLDHSPTPFHACANMVQRLQRAGFILLDEREAWQIEAGGCYCITRNDSSLIAVQLGQRPALQSGLRLVGAHTDSPCLRVKPSAVINRHGFCQLGVEVYGGALLAPWFDRDLSLAGRVTFELSGKVQSRLIDFKRPLAVIPNLAIHLNRQANQGWPINAQTELSPILALAGDNPLDLSALLTQQLAAEQGIESAQILAFELSFYDTQKAAQIGLNGEFIASARLDNLLSCFAGLEALLAAKTSGQHCVLVCTDHEEVGSASACGADGPFLEQVLRRLWAQNEAQFAQILQQSLLISADNAHGLHPNYADKHDGNHAPMLGAGPVIKINSNQRYATNSETAGFFRHLCQREAVPLQNFVSRSDLGCGSTIGPITASRLGVRTLDIGLPTFAMHSIRELADSRDLGFLIQALKAFFACDQVL